MRWTEKRSIKCEVVRNAEANAVRSLVKCEMFDTTCNGNSMHFVGKVRSYVDRFSLAEFCRKRVC